MRRIAVLFFIVVVPVDTPRGRHGHRQQGEESHAAHQQGVALDLQQDIDEGVERSQ